MFTAGSPGEEVTPMKNFKTGKVNIKLRPAPAALKIALIALIVFSVTALVALRWVHDGILAATAEKQAQAAALEGTNAELQEKINQAGSVQGIQDIARDQLGLVSPDTVLIQPE